MERLGLGFRRRSGAISVLDGERWIRPSELSFSYSRQHVRWGLAAVGKGNLFAA